MKTGNYIVGSLNKTTGVFSAVQNPKIHLMEHLAKDEAVRLARNETQKEFVVLQVVSVVTVNDVVWK
jgi:hypothetical protein